MEWKQLISIADKDSIQLVSDNKTGIVVVTFRYKKAVVRALYCPDLEGLYGFSIPNPKTFF